MKSYQNKVDIKNEYNQTVSHCHFTISIHQLNSFFFFFFIFFILDASNVKKIYNNFNFIQYLLNLIPVLKWLPKYSVKNNLAGDLSAGVTVAVMHIPQGIYIFVTCYCVSLIELLNFFFHLLLLIMF